MPVQFKVSNDKLKGIAPIPAGNYTYRFEGFKPKYSKDRNSINFQPQLKIVEPTEFAGRNILENLNSQAEWILQDFVHSMGFEMEKITGTDQSKIPGDFDGDQNNPETWKYTGPLLGATGKCELVVTSYQGKPQNKVKQWYCNVTDCATKYPDIRHSTNLIK